MFRILMVLARGPGRPNGDLANRLELTVALTPQGGLDMAAFGAAPWPTRRLLPDGNVLEGELVRLDDGWAMRGPAGEDAPLWDVESSVLRPGEYVILRRPGGDELFFRIVDVRAN